jgi:hypothetical protein
MSLGPSPCWTRWCACWVAFTVFAVLGCSQPAEIRLQEDFSAYAEGAEPVGPWFADGFLWQVRRGAACVSAPAYCTLRLRDPRWFRRVRLEATVTVRRALTSSWKVAGVGVSRDGERRWHAALVESPDPQRRHYFEVAMGLPGRWPASDGLQVLADRNPNLDWQFNHPYRLVFELDQQRVRGAVMELDGTVRAEKIFQLSPPAVMEGAPVLPCAGFEAEYDDVVLTAAEPSGSPQEQPKRPPVQVPTIPAIHGRRTGFFHVEQLQGAWWVIAPNGEGFYAIGTDHCRYGGHWCEKLGYAPYGKVTQAVYGSEEKWAAVATDRLKAWNFNLLGAGCSESCRYRGLAHTEFLSLGSGYAAFDPLVKQVHWTGFPNVFSPRWEQWCDKAAWRACRPHRDDPWLFGYFLDNELEWWGKTGQDVGLALEAAKLPPDNPAKQALVNLLRAKYHHLASLNQAWGASYSSWQELATAPELTARHREAQRQDFLAFVALAAERYFQVACQAVRRHDPNHMILGCRFAGDAPPGVWEAAGKYCDIVSFNYYGRVDLWRAAAPGTAEQWTSYYRKAQRPLMITEWSFPALDSGLPCQAGAGMRVDTQAQKALCYEIYQRLIFSLPFMVGSDYFMWVDEPALGISSTFPEDSNYGLVNERDEPYAELTQTAARVNAMAYGLHSGQVPEIKVRQVALRQGRIQAEVANTGRRPAEFALETQVGGQAVQRVRLHLAAGERRWVPLPLAVRPPAYIAAVADPERQLPERNWQDNRAGFLYYRPAPWPPAPAGKWVVRWPVLALAGPVELPAAMPLSLDADMLRSYGPAAQVGRRLAAYDLAGHRLNCQLEPWPQGWQVAISWPQIRAQGGTLAYLYLCDQDLPQAPPAVPLQVEGLSWRADNGVLLLEGHGQGNVVDRIFYHRTPMGRLNPLIWEQRGGQNFWTQTTKTRDLLAYSGPVRAAVQVECENEVARPAASAPAAPTPASQSAPPQPHHFAVLHRLWLLPGQSWFADMFVALRNVDEDEMRVRGWFVYLLSAIGDQASDDEVGGPGVPNHWLSVGAWRDGPTGWLLGALPTADPKQRLDCLFWKDPGGGQHPDLRREFNPPASLRPGATLSEPPPSPWVLIFAAQGHGRPWAELGRLAHALGAAQLQLLPSEHP